MIKKLFSLAIMMGLSGVSWAFDPLIGQVKRDPTREIGVYRIELARSKQDQLDRFQRLLDNADSMNQELLYQSMPKENEKVKGR